MLKNHLFLEGVSLKMSFQKFIEGFRSDYNLRILWFELVLFSLIFCSVPYLWPIACLMFIGLSVLLTKPKGNFYTVYILSAAWAWMTMLFAYFLGGWGWGIATGIFVFVVSVNIHLRDLKQPVYQKSVKKVEGETDWPFRRENLN